MATGHFQAHRNKEINGLCEMNLQGGVIIIGSLLWDDAERSEWRRMSLEPLETKIPLKLKIRYGRESGQRRHHTYTMVFSNDRTTDYGQGFLVGFQHRINSEEALRNEAVLLAQAEGIWTTNEPFLAKDWGVVGLLANDNTANGAAVLSAWHNVFREGRCNTGQRHYHHERYAFNSEAPVIDEAGLLQIEWLPEMEAFDFLLATPTAPRPRQPLTADEIATRMIERNYRTYFDGNRASNITTFQDNQILEVLAQHGVS